MKLVTHQKKKKKYFNLSGLSVSTDNQFVTYAVDTVGRRIYTLRFKNLFTGEFLAD